MNFFLEKQLIKFSWTYCPLSICKILKNSSGWSRFIRMCHFRAQNGPFVMIFFFGTKHYYYFDLTIGPFHCAKFKNILTADPELWGYVIFGPKIVHLPQTKFFLEIINITLIYLLHPFILQNFWKTFPAYPELWGCAIFGPKMTHFPKWEFFFFSQNLLINLVSFIHAYLHAKDQSQILIY